MGRILVVRDEHLGRDVALKELLAAHHPGPGQPAAAPSGVTPPVSARFLREARVTGQLEHPSIVPVYELGRRPDGHLYYTMKLVRGRTLTHALAATSSRGQRLALLPHFVDLCQAMAYAHSRGVIHRDLKPANVMIGEFGETVVIDWGLAKVRGQSDIHAHELGRAHRTVELDDETGAARTVVGEALGTPKYMSPEQARGAADLIDERSDVYALGAVLYELLTGQPPFAWARGSSKEILDLVINDAPVPVTDLDPQTPPELAAICGRAMAREPARRYQSAHDLADEVQRFLSGAVVEAYEYRLGEHLRRILRRHRTQVLTAAVSAVALTLVLSFAAVWNLRERRRAEREAATATRVSEFLTSIFEVSDPEQSKGEEITAREILERGAARIETELVEEPLIQARLTSTIGWVSLELGMLAEAETHLQRALEIRQAHLPDDHPELGSSLHELAVLYLDQGRAEEAEASCRRALAIFEQDLRSSGKATNSLDLLASIHHDQGRYDQAETLYRRVLAKQERELGTDHPDVASVLSNLGNNLSIQGRYREAEPMYRRATQIQERALGPDHPGLATTLDNLATNLRLQGRLDEAETLYGRALVIEEKALGPTHPGLAGTIDNLATVYLDQGRLDEAESLYARAVLGDRLLLHAALPLERPVRGLSCRPSRWAARIGSMRQRFSASGLRPRRASLWRDLLELRGRAGPLHPRRRWSKSVRWVTRSASSPR